MTRDEVQAVIDNISERADKCKVESEADYKRGGSKWEYFAGQANGLATAARALTAALTKSEASPTHARTDAATGVGYGTTGRCGAHAEQPTSPTKVVP